MKILSIAAIIFSGMISVAVHADECVKTCESEYSECKGTAETPAAKQACEDDVKECKAGCTSTSP